MVTAPADNCASAPADGRGASTAPAGDKVHASEVVLARVADHLAPAGIVVSLAILFCGVKKPGRVSGDNDLPGCDDGHHFGSFCPAVELSLHFQSIGQTPSATSGKTPYNIRPAATFFFRCRSALCHDVADYRFLEMPKLFPAGEGAAASDQPADIISCSPHEDQLSFITEQCMKATSQSKPSAA